MSKVYYYNGNEYKQRTVLSETEGFVLASAVSGAILSPLALIGKRFEKQLNSEVPNNALYKDTFIKAFELPELKNNKVKLLEAQHAIAPEAYVKGKNAAFDPITKQVIINTDKISIAGFHELGHAMNALNSKYGIKYLQKMRGIGFAIAGLMEYFAVFSRTKPKGAPKSFADIIEDNCGKIAFLALLPTAIEEAVASYRGIKLARNLGIGEPLIKNMKKLYTKAFMTYGGRAVLGGLAVFASRKVMDYFTRPKLVQNDSSDLLV